MKRMILRTLCLAAILCLLAPYALATGSLPYDCYNYDYWNNILYTPAPYVPNGNISGVSLIWQGESLGAFRSPQDLCVSLTESSTSLIREITASWCCPKT